MKKVICILWLMIPCIPDVSEGSNEILNEAYFQTVVYRYNMNSRDEEGLLANLLFNSKIEEGEIRNPSSSSTLHYYYAQRFYEISKEKQDVKYLQIAERAVNNAISRDPENGFNYLFIAYLKSRSQRDHQKDLEKALACARITSYEKDGCLLMMKFLRKAGLLKPLNVFTTIPYLYKLEINSDFLYFVRQALEQRLGKGTGADRKRTASVLCGWAMDNDGLVRLVNIPRQKAISKAMINAGTNIDQRCEVSDGSDNVTYSREAMESLIAYRKDKTNDQLLKSRLWLDVVGLLEGQIDK